MAATLFNVLRVGTVENSNGKLIFLRVFPCHKISVYTVSRYYPPIVLQVFYHPLYREDSGKVDNFSPFLPD